MSTISKEQAIIIIKNGKFYFPAKNHYLELYNPTVSCDFCGKTNIESCVGHLQYDLCLECVNKLTNNYKQWTSMPKPSTDIRTYMEQDIFKDQGLHVTLMAQSMFKPDSCNTFMEQSMFRRNVNVNANVNVNPSNIGSNMTYSQFEPTSDNANSTSNANLNANSNSTSKYTTRMFEFKKD